MFPIQTTFNKYIISFVKIVGFLVFDVYIRYTKKTLTKQFLPAFQTLQGFLSLIKLLHFQWFLDTYLMKRLPIHTDIKKYIEYFLIFGSIVYLFYIIYDHFQSDINNLKYVLSPIVYYILIMVYIFIINSSEKLKKSKVDNFSFLQNIIGVHVTKDLDRNKIVHIEISHHELFVFISSWFISIIIFQILNSNQ